MGHHTVIQGCHLVKFATKFLKSGEISRCLVKKEKYTSPDKFLMKFGEILGMSGGEREKNIRHRFGEIW